MSSDRVKETVEIALKIGLLGLIMYWCFKILSPFLIPLIWGIIIAIAVEPVYLWLNARLRKSPKISATVLSGLLIVFILLPSIFLVKSAVNEARFITNKVRSGEIDLTEASSTVKDWPVVGDFAHDLWSDVNTNLKGVLDDYEKEVVEVTKFLFKSAANAGFGIIQFLIAIIIAGVLLATPQTRSITILLFRKAAGGFGSEFAKISEETIKNVVKGILAVAVIQSFVMGTGMVIAGVPLAGLWAVVVLFWSVVQLPTIILVIPLLIFIWSDLETGWAVFWTVFFVLSGAIDNVLKPILMGQGLPVPMFIIFLGAIGGLLWNGIIGLFIGSIVLSLGYKLLIYWLKRQSDNEAFTEVQNDLG
ncbi:MAG: AI-2E family transporter [Flavobacteriales bacterium]|nr:AI-2E family transporter [Flavobacteriales bacterium]